MDSARPRCLPDYRREPSASLPVSIICQADHLYDISDSALYIFAYMDT